MASGTIKKNVLKSGTISATTTEYGNIVSSIPKAGKIVVATNITPSSGYGGGYLLDSPTVDTLVFQVRNNRGDALANTAVTITYYYYEI